MQPKTDDFEFDEGALNDILNSTKSEELDKHTIRRATAGGITSRPSNFTNRRVTGGDEIKRNSIYAGAVRVSKKKVYMKVMLVKF